VSERVTQIDQFMQKIGNKGGMSLSTGFDVSFQFGAGTTFGGEFYTDGDEHIVHMLCDEAQLPNVQSATGQMNRYLGEGQVYYPHTRFLQILVWVSYVMLR